MGVYIGDVYIPFVSKFTVDKSAKPIEEFKHLGNVPPQIAEFQADVLSTAMSGTLFKAAGDVRTVDQYAEDITALVERWGVYNYLHDYQGRSGWMVLESGDTDKSAESVLIRDYAMSGKFMPKNKYQARMHTAPVIRTNDFSFTLGVNDCDNYVAIPIGATYSGGDGSTITREGEDGIITLVLATAANDILFDVAEDDIDNGEVKIWDEMGAGEASWVKVFSQDHNFTGSVVIQNGLYRIKIVNAYYIVIYRWDTTAGAWGGIDDFTCGTYMAAASAYITKSNPDEAVCELDNGVEITLRRGHPPLIDTGTEDLLCVSLTPADQTTTTENYLVLATSTYICSDEIFSIVNATKNLDSGKKWIFYETDAPTAEDIAHQAMVNSRLKRELVAR